MTYTMIYCNIIVYFDKSFIDYNVYLCLKSPDYYINLKTSMEILSIIREESSLYYLLLMAVVVPSEARFALKTSSSPQVIHYCPFQCGSSVVVLCCLFRCQSFGDGFVC